MDNFKKTIQEGLIEHLSFLPPEAIIVIISALPIIELRGGLPAGAFLDLSFQSALVYSILGNLLPIAPILLLFRPISKWLVRFNFYDRFYHFSQEDSFLKNSLEFQVGVLLAVLSVITRNFSPFLVK
ncbi:small multi-drug export protein [Alkalihalobacterium chitinilyticum]|uniref:Small multi-drug export protein n=1 Tax=Alkalihalobacterium chitinilyticum TaxID=2980103 RepID=A0ABT5VF18_9BACI|nr:small multi-drug export protein [Alkalihalobacterium chitinilyticum]MDE5413277.1 small multi-drug export protein [Alkalihalobacterium chitinilyticum]